MYSVSSYSCTFILVHLILVHTSLTFTSTIFNLHHCLLFQVWLVSSSLLGSAWVEWAKEGGSCATSSTSWTRLLWRWCLWSCGECFHLFMAVHVCVCASVFPHSGQSQRCFDSFGDTTHTDVRDGYEDVCARDRCVNSQQKGTEETQRPGWIEQCYISTNNRNIQQQRNSSGFFLSALFRWCLGQMSDLLCLVCAHETDWQRAHCTYRAAWVYRLVSPVSYLYHINQKCQKKIF